MKTKTMKTILFSLFFMTFSLMSFDVSFAEPDKGPFETYLDCADKCIEKYGRWTLRRTACAADCYLELLTDLVKMAQDLAIDLSDLIKLVED
jgi:hypothetical protein